MAKQGEKKTTIDITKKKPLQKANNEKMENKEAVKKEKKIRLAFKKGKNVKDKKVKNTLNEKVVKRYNFVSVVMISLVLFIFSFIIAAQLNTVGNTDIISTGMREAELLLELQNLNNKHNNLKKEYDKSQAIVEEYKNSASTNDTLIASMKTSLEQAKLLAGLTTVKGEGVVIILQDSTDTTVSVEAGLVHDTDIMSIVNELRAAGAEAISVNGERILSTTAIRCVGPTIQINGTKVASPFHIKAIGNAKYLESALNIRGGVVDNLRSYGILVEIATSDGIVIDKHDDTLVLKYAKEVK